MDENMNDETERHGAGESRRDLLKKAAVGGAVVWATPAVLATRAAAQASTPPPPQCTWQDLTTDWNAIPITGAGNYNKYGYDGFPPAIGTSGWNGENVDLVSSSFAATPPWTSGTNWLDLVGSGSAGSISTTVVACAGDYTLSFQYSRYIGSATVQTVVDGVADPAGPFAAPLPGPALYSRTFTVAADFTGVSIVILGTGASTNVGPAVGNISLVRL